MTASIEIIRHSAAVEAMFEPLRPVIGRDFDSYRGHVYRVLSYALHILGPGTPHRGLVEAALVHHDVGLWTDGALAYLEPSIARALAANAEGGWGHDPALLRDAILWHHKLLPFRGPQAEVVNAVRRADWIEASDARFRMGLAREQIAAVRAAIPDHGFLGVLLRLSGELNGGRRLGGLGIVLHRVYKW